jgi:DNA-binding NarL/FixJ family response regulator
MPKIFLVDDHEYVRRQLRSLIEAQENWEVCCEAADGREALEKEEQLDAHVTVMDFNMPVMDGLKASRAILSERPDASILLVTVFASQQLCEEAQKAGLKGFCSKSETACILKGIEKLLRGETHFPKQGHWAM